MPQPEASLCQAASLRLGRSEAGPRSSMSFVLLVSVPDSSLSRRCRVPRRLSIRSLRAWTVPSALGGRRRRRLAAVFRESRRSWPGPRRLLAVRPSSARSRLGLAGLGGFGTRSSQERLSPRGGDLVLRVSELIGLLALVCTGGGDAGRPSGERSAGLAHHNHPCRGIHIRRVVACPLGERGQERGEVDLGSALTRTSAPSAGIRAGDRQWPDRPGPAGSFAVPRRRAREARRPRHGRAQGRVPSVAAGRSRGGQHPAARLTVCPPHVAFPVRAQRHLRRIQRLEPDSRLFLGLPRRRLWPRSPGLGRR